MEIKNEKEKTKEEILSEIILKNQGRVHKGLFYTTLYGIGFWSIFCSKADLMVAKNLHEYLKVKNIKYSNEFSDAGWVYRFKIGQTIDIHNKLLCEFSCY